MSNQHLDKLIQGCRRNDPTSQRAVYEQFYAVVYGICLRYAGSSEEARELANDAFYKAFTRLDNFEAGTNFGGWLYTIARRTALDRYRVAINQPIIERETAFDTGQATHEEYRLLDRMDAEEKLRLVQLLPPAYRTVFNLYVVEEYSHEEIATMLDISVGTSKSNLAKARQRLKSLVAQHYHKV